MSRCAFGLLNGLLTLYRVKGGKIGVCFVKLVVLPFIAPENKALSRLYKAVDGDCCLLTSRNRVNRKLGTGINVSANKDIGFR